MNNASEMILKSVEKVPTLAQVIDKQPKKKGIKLKKKLQTVCKRSETTINNYIYGYTPVPEDLQRKIVKAIESEVDFNGPYMEHLKKQRKRINAKLSKTAAV